MSNPDRFDKDSIDMRLLDSQIIYHSGFVAGRAEFKKDVVFKLNKLITDADAKNDNIYVASLVSIKRMIENL